MANASILWRRLDRPGHEAARLDFQDGSWHLRGTAVFAHHNQPCALKYRVTCDGRWYTAAARVAGWVGSEQVELEFVVDASRRWWVNGVEAHRVAGCIDIDLNFSPSTNLLPVRRLALPVGQEAQVRAAWLRFPSFTLEPLVQTYRRLGDATYRYESGGGAFVRELQLNEAGFVTLYPDFWTIESP